MSDEQSRTRRRPHDAGLEGERVRGTATETEPGDAVSGAGPGREARRSGLRGRLAASANRLFSPRAFLLALVLCAGGLFAASAAVPSPLSGLLGIFTATFAFGLVASGPRYAEAAAAAGAVAAGSVLVDFLVWTVFGGFGLPIVAVGAALGAASGALGTYFGRDLRDGLTRDVEP